MGEQLISHLFEELRTVRESHSRQAELLEHRKQWERRDDALQIWQDEVELRKVVLLGQLVHVVPLAEQEAQLVLQASH
jgi:hypothetical protein